MHESLTIADGDGTDPVGVAPVTPPQWPETLFTFGDKGTRASVRSRRTARVVSSATHAGPPVHLSLGKPHVGDLQLASQAGSECGER